MSRRLITLLFAFTAIFFCLLPQKSLAFDIPSIDTIRNVQALSDLLQQNESSFDKARKDFCRRREGNQMNLETWFSGKCVEDSETYSGEGVGFSDIIILDLAEHIWGRIKPDETFFDKIQKLLDIATRIQASNLSASDKNLAMEKSRLDYFMSNNNGLTGGLTKVMAAVITNPPATTNNYLTYISNNLKNHGVIKQAYAAESPQAGYGFNGLQSFLPIWKAFRNISYIIFVLVFVVYGFMMMFRVNINAKTVITIELALPRLIMTLLIITFSYAIVGFIVDMMFVFYYLVLNILASQNLIIPENWGIKLASGQFGALPSFITNFLVSIPASAVGILNLIFGGSAILDLTMGIVGFPFGFIIGIVLFFAIVISYFKLCTSLLQSFFTVIISLVTAPIILLQNVLPGSTAAETWIMGIIGNLSVFPVSLTLLTFSYVLMAQPLAKIGLGSFFGVTSLDPGGYVMYVPFTSMLPMTGDGMMAIVGIGLLLMANKYVEIVKNALKVPPFKYGNAIEDPLKAGWGNAQQLGGFAKKSYDSTVAAAKGGGTTAPAASTNASGSAPIPASSAPTPIASSAPTAPRSSAPTAPHSSAPAAPLTASGSSTGTP